MEVQNGVLCTDMRKAERQGSLQHQSELVAVRHKSSQHYSL